MKMIAKGPKTNQKLQANGRGGVNGPTAPFHVAMGPKSGLELAVEVMVLVQGSGQRPKIAFWISVQ